MKREMDLIREILLYAKEYAPTSFDHDQEDILEKFGIVEYDDLDTHLLRAWKGGLIKAQKTSGGWFIDELTLAGQEYLASMGAPTQVDALLEQNEILRQQLASMQEAGKLAQGANRIAWCAIGVSTVSAAAAVLSQQFVREFWIQFFGG